jgi:hypothetical protein
MEAFCLLTAKTTFEEMTNAIKSDILQSFKWRMELLLDELEFELKSDENTLISTSTLPRRVMYPLEGTSLVSLYETDQNPAADDLAFIFSVQESSKFFEYPETEVENFVVENIPEKRAETNHTYIYAVLVLIIAILISIIIGNLAS